MPFTLIYLRMGGRALLLSLSLCLLSACAPLPIRVAVMPPPTRVPQDNPAREAQSFLLQEAYRAFWEGRYPTAALFFKRYVDVAQDSSRLAEAHLWLGYAHEQLGDYRAAVEMYRVVAAGSLLRQEEGAFYEKEALRRLDELHSSLPGPSSHQVRQLMLRLRIDQLPPLSTLTPWFGELAQAGVTALSISPAMPGSEGFGGEMVKVIADAAHRAGLRLWVALDLHEGLGIDIRPEWRATVRHKVGKDGVSPSRVDVTNVAYQSYLEEVIRALNRTDCDGVLLAARSAGGFADEFSDDSFRRFAASFGLAVSPDEIFEISEADDATAPERPANYWRWVGWKARNYAQLAARLSRVLREQNATAQLLVEVHHSTVTAPLEGLAQFGEDLAELTPRTGGAVIVRHEGPVTDGAFNRLARQLDSPDRVWAGIAMTVETNPPAMADVKRSSVGLAEFGRQHLVIDVTSAHRVP